jgi:hypothetical protein
MPLCHTFAHAEVHAVCLMSVWRAPHVNRLLSFSFWQPHVHQDPHTRTHTPLPIPAPSHPHAFAKTCTPALPRSHQRILAPQHIPADSPPQSDRHPAVPEASRLIFDFLLRRDPADAATAAAVAAAAAAATASIKGGGASVDEASLTTSCCEVLTAGFETICPTSAAQIELLTRITDGDLVHFAALQDQIFGKLVSGSVPFRSIQSLFVFFLRLAVGCVMSAFRMPLFNS